MGNWNLKKQGLFKYIGKFYTFFSCKEECYYMKNPFEPPDFHKGQRDYTIEDFLILGSNCFICNQQICVDEVNILIY